jgi:hypothetical protein
MAVSQPALRIGAGSMAPTGATNAAPRRIAVWRGRGYQQPGAVPVGISEPPGPTDTEPRVTRSVERRYVRHQLADAGLTTRACAMHTGAGGDNGIDHNQD